MDTDADSPLSNKMREGKSTGSHSTDKHGDLLREDVTACGHIASSNKVKWYEPKWQNIVNLVRCYEGIALS